MDDQQRQTLESLLRTTEKVPPQHRLEALEVAARTNWELYRQESDEEGMAIYAPLLKLIPETQLRSDSFSKKLGICGAKNFLDADFSQPIVGFKFTQCCSIDIIEKRSRMKHILLFTSFLKHQER